MSEREASQGYSTVYLTKPAPLPNECHRIKADIVGAFCLDGDGNYEDGCSHLRFYKHTPLVPNSSYDLNQISHLINNTFEHEIKVHERISTMHHLLDWMDQNDEVLRKEKPSFVTYRGVLTRLMATSYDENEFWTIRAYYKNGTIYIHFVLTEAWLKTKKEQFNDNWQNKCSVWGRAFENFVLRKHPNVAPNPKEVNDASCHFVFNCKVGNHNLLYLAEMDGIVLDGTDTTESSNFITARNYLDDIRKAKLVEIKTTRFFDRGNPYDFIRCKKYLRWWCQTTLANVSLIAVGMRDSSGIVRSVEEFDPNKLPEHSLGWSPRGCTDFLDDLLHLISTLLDADENKTVTLERKRRSYYESWRTLPILVKVETKEKVCPENLDDLKHRDSDSD